MNPSLLKRKVHNQQKCCADYSVLSQKSLFGMKVLKLLALSFTISSFKNLSPQGVKYLTKSKSSCLLSVFDTLYF